MHFRGKKCREASKAEINWGGANGRRTELGSAEQFRRGWTRAAPCQRVTICGRVAGTSRVG